MSSFGFGISAALASPLVMTIGFCVWQSHWHGSAFALNLYKCTLASTAFLVTVLLTSRLAHESRLFPSDTFTSTTVGYLFLSSAIGIIVGDVLWLQALQYLGARRVILVDSLKPFVAAFLGYVILGERIRLTALGGIILTVVGILLVSFNSTNASADDKKEAVSSKQQSTTRNTTESPHVVPAESVANKEILPSTTVDPNETKVAFSEDMDTTASRSIAAVAFPNTETTTNRSKDDTDRGGFLWRGYMMSMANVVLDTYGAVLTKQFGLGMTVWEINLLRFGFAAVVMIGVSLGMTVYHRIRNATPRNNPTECDASRMAVDSSIPDCSDPQSESDPKAETLSASSTPTCPWYALPIKSPMTLNSWLLVSIGVALVTFLASSLSNYALFNIALALTMTLTSIGPLYALPLTYWLSSSGSTAGSDYDRQPITLRAMGGTILTVGGIAVLAFWGTLPDNEDK